MKMDNNPVTKPLFQFFSRSNNWENETEIDLHIPVILIELQGSVLSYRDGRFLLGFLVKV